MNRGEKIRKTITILKVKNEVPTVISVDDKTYILQHENQYKRPNKSIRNGEIA